MTEYLNGLSLKDGVAQKVTLRSVPQGLADGFGAFTRHPAGLLGQPFLQLVTDEGLLLRPLQRPYLGRALQRPEDQSVRHLTSRKTAGLIALRACLVNEAHH